MNDGVVALKHGKVEYQKYIAVNWTFLNVCNYSCSYCIPELYNGQYKGIDVLQAMRFVHRLNQLKKDSKIFFEFTGGEITFYPGFDMLMSFIKDKGGYTGIITNLSRPLSWWETRANLLDHVCASFHCERGNQEKFLEILKFLRDKVTLHVNIMMLPERFDELYAFAQKIAREVPGASISLQPLFQDFGHERYVYTEMQDKILRSPDLPFPGPPSGTVFRGGMKSVLSSGDERYEDTTLLISKNQNRYQGWTCAAGVENLSINYAGSIFRGLCRAGGAIGHIRDKELKLPQEGIICPFERCKCAFDIMSTKAK